MTSPSKPAALHVGFSKCASTFLQALFTSHPGIFLVNQSHFFSPFELTDGGGDARQYQALFSASQPGQLTIESDEHIVLPLFHPVLLAAATTLDSIAEVIERIRAVAPTAKIILVVRNQTDLLVSRYSEYVLGGGTCSLDVFVEEFLCCSKDNVNYYENYYAQIVKMFRAAFGESNFLLIMQEELLHRERQILVQLWSFLGVCPLESVPRDSVSRRVGLSKLGISVMRALNRLIVVRQEMSFNKAQVRVPYLLYKVIQRTIREIDYRLPKAVKGNKSEILSDRARERIGQVFEPDNRELSLLLGRDLSQYGYYKDESDL